MMLLMRGKVDSTEDTIPVNHHILKSNIGSFVADTLEVKIKVVRREKLEQGEKYLLSETAANSKHCPVQQCISMPGREAPTIVIG